MNINPAIPILDNWDDECWRSYYKGQVDGLRGNHKSILYYPYYKPYRLGYKEGRRLFKCSSRLKK